MAKIIVVYGGGFQPFHAGHLSSYLEAKEAFPNADFYVAASNDTKTRPIPFNDKQFLAQQAGVTDPFVQVKMPINPTEILDRYSPKKDIFILVRSERDPVGYTKKDGSPGYYQPFDSLDKCQSFGYHGYVFVTHKKEFKLNGQVVYSGTQVRDMYMNSDDKGRQTIVKQLYPQSQKPNSVKKLLDTYIGSQSVEPTVKPAKSAIKSLQANKLKEQIQLMRPLMKKATIEQKYKMLKLIKEATRVAEGMGGSVVFSGTGDNGGKYEIIQSGPNDFMIHANGKHIDSYDSLQRAMSVLKNEVPGLQQGVAEGLNEFAQDGFNGGNDNEGFSTEIAKMAQEDGFTKGVSLADGATLERAITINHWHSQHGGMYKQYFAKGFKAGRMNKIRHDNKQYNLNLKLMKDGSIRHGEQGVAEGSLNEFAIPGGGDGDSGRWYNDDELADIIGDDWFEDFDVSNDGFNIDAYGEKAKKNLVGYANTWFDDKGYNVNVMGVEHNDVDHDLQWYIVGSFHNPRFANEGVAEGQADQVKKIVKKNGKPVGEIGTDPEASPGNGNWYVKHYASGYDVVGFDNAEEALAELKHCMKQGVAEGSLEEDEYDKMLRDLLKARPDLTKKYAKDVQKSKDIESGKELNKLVKKNPGVLKTYSDAVKRDKKSGMAEGSESSDNLVSTLNSFGYYSDNGNVYVNDDSGDKIARQGSNWKHQSGKRGAGAEELGEFLGSKQGVAEGRFTKINEDYISEK